MRKSFDGLMAIIRDTYELDPYVNAVYLCKKAIEEAIALKFNGLHLEEDAARQVLKQFGEERMTFVMANTLRELSYDGRFSRQNKDWAGTYRNPGKYQSGEESESGLCDRKPPSSVRWFY